MCGRFIVKFAMFVGMAAGGAWGAERPNIVWLTSEDTSPYLGCYGDALARTPHLDKLAAEGVRYTHAYANFPVCAAARSTIAWGMYARTLGTQNMRSRYAVPAGVAPYPEALRAAGYYCTNNSKTDYNVMGDDKAWWDECGGNAHYSNRPEGKPFFAVFNTTRSHESQVREAKLPALERWLDPAKFPLPPYHPDDPRIREDWVRCYENIHLMDRDIGQWLQELEDAGVAEDTIVVYYGDHGGVLARSKRFLYDTGTRVPLLVRVPEKWKDWVPVGPGQVCGEPVSFVDLAPTVLALAGAERPARYQGRVFLGPARDPAPRYVYLARNRMDARLDTVRAVTDGEWRYIRNFSPHRIGAQSVQYAYGVQENHEAWEEAFRAGRCNEVQSIHWKVKPAEELYHTAEDPWEAKNLAGEAGQAQRLQNMRTALYEHIVSTRDTGFIPESLYQALAGNGTIYEYAQGKEYPVGRILTVADAATARDPVRLKEIRAALKDPHPVIRYWGAVGCAVLGREAAPALKEVRKLLKDGVPAVRTAAAEGVAVAGDREAGIAALLAETRGDNSLNVLEAMNALEALGEARRVPVEHLQALANSKGQEALNAQRLAGWWLDSLHGQSAGKKPRQGSKKGKAATGSTNGGSNG